ncbi:MAG: oligopeptidase A, partial [Pseudomonadota bacterium]
MNTANPLLLDLPLPAFDAIRPEHVEVAIRELLASHRTRINAIESTRDPSFATVVEPMEELHHELTRAWSPVSHLNGVMNSDALREGYNACLPLLSEYGTDIAQSEKLYRAYSAVLAREGDSLDAAQKTVIEHALRDFRLAGVALDGPKKDRFKAVMLELSALGAKFEENVLDATNAFTYAITDEDRLDGINATVIEQARDRAAAKGEIGWLL